MSLDIILDYSIYTIEDISYGLNKPGSRAECFFEKVGWCPFCNRQAQRIVSNSNSFSYEWGPWGELREIVWGCDCGWWQIDYYSYIEQEPRFKDWQKRLVHAHLKEFEIGNNDIPITALQNYIDKNEEKIFMIHDKKMEELVASVFKDFYQCSVEIVGKSGDGGVDLLLIESDTPTIIQVKRRKSPDKTEGVKEIRELIGATLLNESKNCAFVTTADHFSQQAIAARDQIIKTKDIGTFELYDLHRFLGILHLICQKPNFIWKELLQFEHDNIK